MVLPYMKIPPPGINLPYTPPPANSNQTPIGPGNPWKLQGVPQQIKSWLPHTTPNLDNNYQGIPQHMKTKIPTNLPPGVNPGNYAFIIEPNQPGKIKQVGYTVNPINNSIVTCGYQGINPWEHRVPIQQIVPPGVYPDTYNGTKKMSYDTTSGFLIGGICGFVLGAIILTATGKSLARATVNRATSYIQPKS